VISDIRFLRQRWPLLAFGFATVLSGVVIAAGGGHALLYFSYPRKLRSPIP